MGRARGEGEAAHWAQSFPYVLSLGTGDAWLVGYAMAACCDTTLPRDKWSEITLLQQPWPCFF